MDTLFFDRAKTYGNFKPMNGVNNGPIYFIQNPRNNRLNNFEAYKAASIPYARNHDASFNDSYGGEHTVDISAIFPNFDADPYDEASYDFVCTDEYILATEMTGTKTFYRLGQKIEHGVKKYHIAPPKDMKKWAIICEHIIRHYTEGWANGFNYDIEYWEIWNEPDGAEGFEIPPTWEGTRAEFFDMYSITAIHLKECFPHLKIGGPSASGIEEWADDFLSTMRERNAPVDFYSWHCYTNNIQYFKDQIYLFRDILDRNGYQDTESINAEWNYVKGWQHPDYVNSFKTIKSCKGAAFTLAAMCVGQKAPIDMLLYYDARPCAFNGIFHTDTLETLKGYYPFLWFSKFNDFEEIRCDAEIEDIYSLSGIDRDGKTMTLLTYYTDEEGMEEKTFCLDFGKQAKYEIYLLDEIHDGTLEATVEDLTLTMQPNTCVMVREV